MMDNKTGYSLGAVPKDDNRNNLFSSSDGHDVVQLRRPEDAVANFSKLLGEIGQEYLNISGNSMSRAAEIQAKHFALIKAEIPQAKTCEADKVEQLYNDNERDVADFLPDCQKAVWKHEFLPPEVLHFSKILGNRKLGLISIYKKDAILVAQSAARMMMMADILDRFFVHEEPMKEVIEAWSWRSAMSLPTDFDVQQAVNMKIFRHIGEFEDEPPEIASFQAAAHLCFVFLGLLNQKKGDLSLLYHSFWKQGNYRQFYTDAIRTHAYKGFDIAAELFQTPSDPVQQAVTDLNAVKESIDRRFDISVPEGMDVPPFDVVVDVLMIADVLFDERDLLNLRMAQISCQSRPY